ncbi:MAG: fluoride efflux transporter CrcB [Bacteroidales bacterium]
MALKYLLLIGTGGFLGTISRFLVQSYVVRHLPWTFPLGTLMVNVAGCLLIGLLWGFTEKPFHLGATWRFFLATGFCGGFTTFSSFGLENMNLLRHGDYLHFAMYTSLSLGLGIAAVFIGFLLARNLA